MPACSDFTPYNDDATAEEEYKADLRMRQSVYNALLQEISDDSKA